MVRMTQPHVGGHVALDFNNTLSWGDGLEDRLASPRLLARWLRQAGLRGRPPSLPDTRELRALLHRIFLAAARRRRPPTSDLARFERRLRPALGRLRVSFRGGRLKWAPPDPEAALLWEAARLLASPDLPLLKACANPRCGWLFLDRSRARRRRWCEMSVCGSRAKARAYYRRRQAARS